MAIANEQNLRQSLPQSRPFGLRIRARRNDPFRHLVGDDWQKEHWFATRHGARRRAGADEWPLRVFPSG